jgi:hypothetical protein
VAAPSPNDLEADFSQDSHGVFAHQPRESSHREIC